MGSLFGRDLITTQDWSVDELTQTIDLARKLKLARRQGKEMPKFLERKNFFMLFYASSTRTRGAFEAGTALLGGHAPYIDVSTTRIKAGEAVKDIAKMYDIYGDGIGVRVLDDAIDFVYGEGRKIIEQIAEVAKVPVINMADCTYHPTQAIGDIMTVKNKVGAANIEGKKFVVMWGYSSRLRGTCSINAEALIATRLGMDVVLAHPPGFDLDKTIIEACGKYAKESGGDFEISHDFEEALSGANVVFPRSWVTSELSRVGATAFGVDREIQIHNKYRDWMLKQEHVDDLMGNPAIVTHVLPVFRGEEATDEVMDGPNSVI
ncbi:MAG: ornithine carbamoyltransferase, partial [Candidatus Hodarchaeota archaeon]